MKRLASGVLNVFMVVSGLLAAAVLGLPVLLGAKPVAVLSGSMEPTLNVGGIALTERVDPATLRVGDIITFHPSGDSKIMITHRIIEVIPGPGLTFQTQGDAVSKPDPFTVPSDAVVGKVRFSAPQLGYIIDGVAKGIRTPWGFGMTMGVTSLLLVGSEVRNIVSLAHGGGRRSRLRQRRIERLKKRWPRAARRLS